MSEYRLVMKGVVKTFPGVKALDHAQLGIGYHIRSIQRGRADH